jgi:hypothetical protein
MLAACLPVKARPLDEGYMRLDMIRKTSLLRKIEPTAMRSSSRRQGSFYNSLTLQLALQNARAPKTIWR